jgi:hypothetical protein
LKNLVSKAQTRLEKVSDEVLTKASEAINLIENELAAQSVSSGQDHKTK